jgi:hypothetical protein
MKHTVENYREKHEAWALSEIKGTIIVCFQKYLENRSGYIEAVQLKNMDPRMAKSNMIATLDAYFQNCQAPFIPFILENESAILKLMLESGVEVEECASADDLRIKYETIAFKGMDYSANLLFFMGNLLTKWNTERGYFRMLETSQIYDTFEDKMQAILDEEEN